MLQGTETTAAGKGLLCAFVHSLIQQSSQTGIHLWSENRGKSNRTARHQAAQSLVWSEPLGTFYESAEQNTAGTRHSCAFTTKSRIAMQKKSLLLFQLWRNPTILAFQRSEVKVTQSRLTLCDPMDCTRQAPLSMGFSRQEYWGGLSFPSPGESSRPRDWTQVSCIAGRLVTDWATREALVALTLVSTGTPGRGK